MNGSPSYIVILRDKNNNLLSLKAAAPSARVSANEFDTLEDARYLYNTVYGWAETQSSGIKKVAVASYYIVNPELGFEERAYSTKYIKMVTESSLREYAAFHRCGPEQLYQAAIAGKIGAVIGRFLVTGRGYREEFSNSAAAMAEMRRPVPSPNPQYKLWYLRPDGYKLIVAFNNK